MTDSGKVSWRSRSTARAVLRPTDREWGTAWCTQSILHNSCKQPDFLNNFSHRLVGSGKIVSRIILGMISSRSVLITKSLILCPMTDSGLFTN